MNVAQKKAILQNAQRWFLETVAENHIKNTEKLASPEEFNINPFLTPYLANFLTGNSSAESIAKVLLYPRILGTSITTSFGTNIQKFSSTVLSSFGSAIPGIDIEFVDAVDGCKKYCQLKAGPNCINKDDVETIQRHFDAALRLARTNSLRIATDDLVVGVLYGEEQDLSGHFQRIEKQYHHPVITGQIFWHRLTGDTSFYNDLIEAIAQVAKTVDAVKIVEKTIQNLAASDSIRSLSRALRE